MNHQTIRKGFRIVGRLVIFLLLAMLCSTRLMNPEMVNHTYLSAYQTFRQMGIVKRIFMLPYAREIQQFFEILLLIDFIYEGITGILIVFGKSFGGWMMFFWYLAKIIFCYSPYVLNAPRLPFTYRERFQIVRSFAILGVSLALTNIYKPIQPRKKAEQEKSN